VVGFGKYIKKAFTNRWNLLWVGGGVAFALLTPIPSAVLAVVAAAEITYLGLLGTHPKFQAYVDAQAAKQARAKTSVSTQQSLDRITRTLPKELLDRFQALRTRCVDLQQIAAELKQTSPGSADVPFEHFQVAGLDRLLWIHLRLLFTQFALYRFLKQTSEEQIQADIKRLEGQLAKLAPAGANGQDQRVRKALEDNLQTSRDRLANLQRARDNHDLVKLEIDRLENKIRSLSELAVNRLEPDYISGQVDQVASSMLETEKTMNELRFVTGLDSVEEAPSLLQGDITPPQRAKHLN
jgi:predicted  nucleic acid-binding Zn-ribbon protein